jgi:DNA invertase Pin-like site-specific DNA recombinase
MLHLHAALAERERKLISARTTAALAHHKAGADTFAFTVAPAIAQAQTPGAKDVAGNCRRLERTRHCHGAGGRWEAQTVANVMRRVA